MDSAEDMRFAAALPAAMLTLAAFIAVPAITSAAAATSPPRSAQSLYSGCVTCHQIQGWGTSDGNIPNIAGQHLRYVEHQIRQFRAGVRVDDAMQVVAAHPEFSDPISIRSLARYISELAPNPAPLHGPGEALAGASETYARICAACHGADGEGVDAQAVPRLAGQQFPYLLRQIKLAAQLHRELAPPEMASALRGQSDRQKQALADYLSRLSPSH